MEDQLEEDPAAAQRRRNKAQSLRLDITPNTPKANLDIALHLDLKLLYRTGTWLPFPCSLTAAAAAEDEGDSQQGRCIYGGCIVLTGDFGSFGYMCDHLKKR